MGDFVSATLFPRVTALAALVDLKVDD